MKNRLSKLIVALSLILATVFCCFSVSGCKEDEQGVKTYTHEQIVSRFSTSAVTITVGNKEGTGIVLKSSGGEAIIATCYHLSGYDATALKVYDGAHDYENIETLGYDIKFDLAFFKVNAWQGKEGIDYISGGYFTDEKKPTMGKQVTVIGNAFGDGISAFDGIVSLSETVQLIEGYYKPLVRVTAPITAGCSGCPVFDDEGKLLGMGQGIKTGVENASFVFPASIMIEMAKKVLANPKNDPIERADISFKTYFSTESDYIATLVVGQEEYDYYASGKIKLDGAEVEITLDGEPTADTLTAKVNAFLKKN